MMNNWTYEETVVAFWTYCRIPFKKCNSRHPEIIRVAKLIGRSPSALNMKIGNLGRLDPDLRLHGISGLTRGSQLDKEVWMDFSATPDELAYEAQKILARLSNEDVVKVSGLDLENLPEGKEREIVVKKRIGQQFFHNAVITSYNNICCISGVSNRGRLDACHIADWAEKESHRTNPCNGLCMNPFFHRAYDSFYLGISPDYKIHVSESLIFSTSQEDFRNYLKLLQGKEISMPDRFFPDKDLLAEHYDKYRQTL